LRKPLLFTVGLVFLLGACSLFGPKEFKPTGTPFTLGSSITVTSFNGEPPGWDPRGLFALGLTIRSATGDTVLDTLPAGLFLVPGSNEVQNIILLKPFIIRALPGDTAWTIAGFCCNSGLHAPGGEDGFDFGPVTDNALFEQLIGIVADKDYTSALVTVQQAVWDITDNGRLSQTWVDQLNALPPDTTNAPVPVPGPTVRQLKQAR